MSTENFQNLILGRVQHLTVLGFNQGARFMSSSAYQALGASAKHDFSEAYFAVSETLSMYALALLNEVASLELTLTNLVKYFQAYCRQCGEHGVHNTPSSFEDYRQKLVASGLTYLEAVAPVVETEAA